MGATQLMRSCMYVCVCMYFYVHRAKWIKNAGYTYKKDAIVLLSRSPVFAMIKEVYLLNDNIIGFKVTKLLYQNFNSHLHAHCVQVSHDSTFVLLNTLIIPNPMYMHHMQGELLVILPYQIDFSD